MSGKASILAKLALAVGIPLLALLGLEGGLRLFGYGRPTSFLIPDGDPAYVRSNPDYASAWFPDNFGLQPLNLRIRRQKPAHALRVVVLGESAAQGVPVPSFGLGQQLRAQLRGHYPGRDVEVIDTGIVAVNSHAIYQIARELADYEPDLFVVYAGNNEVVGPYGPGCAYLNTMPPLWVIRASVWVRSLRLGQLVGNALAGFSRWSRRTVEWGGMSMFVNHGVAGDDPRLRAVYANFALNLRGVMQAATSCGAKTIFCTPLCNLADCPPFLSQHRPGLSAAELAQWSQAFDEGLLAWRLDNPAKARPNLAKAEQIDPEYADTHWLLGKIAEGAGDGATARSEYIAAVHWDGLRFRPDQEIYTVLRDLGRGDPFHAAVIDTAYALGSDAHSPTPPAGRDLLFEHVHLDWDGNYLVGRMVAQACATELGERAGSGRWLEKEACAAALGYTPHERLPMLLRIQVLVRKPPFTQQLTYAEDQVRLDKAIELAARDARSPAVQAAAAKIVRAAIQADPANPALAGIFEGIELDQGDLAGALAEARRVGSLLPNDFAIGADEASILQRMGNTADAERVLNAALVPGTDWNVAAPALADFYTRSKREKDGKAWFARAIRARPNDSRLKLSYANFLRTAGENAEAEALAWKLWKADGINPDAIETLAAVLQAEGKQKELDDLSDWAGPNGGGDVANDLREIKLWEAKKNEANALWYMMQAEAHGPTNATFELTLALKLYQANRLPEALQRLAIGARLSQYEGNPQVTESIVRLIARLQRRA